MKVLMIGCGVIGTIYGYALQKSGVSVTHYVREDKREKPSKGIALRLLDGRVKKSGTELDDTYHPNMITNISEKEDYDLVIVSVNFYQLEDVLKLISGKFNQATILIFNNLWDGYELIEKYIPDSQYLLGFPGAGGGFNGQDHAILNGAILKQVHIGDKNNAVSENVIKVKKLFNKAKIDAVVEENMLHWLWVHFAINSGLNSAMVSAGGAQNFLSSTACIKQAMINVKEALKVCEARSIQIKKFSEARTFSMPNNILAVAFKLTMRYNKPNAKVVLEYKGIEELKRIYHDVVHTAHQLNVSIPNLDSVKNEIDALVGRI